MNQRIALTKKLLKNSLTELLQTRSIYQVSIRELCQNAGINRSTFYKHYGSQYDLLAEMEQDLLQNIETTLRLPDAYSENVIEQIMIYLENNIDFVRLLLNSNVDPELPEKLFSLEPVRRLLGNLTTGMPEAESDYYYCFVLHGAYEMVRKWINQDERESPAWAASLFFKFIRP
ncbi:MAG: TetR/AcrR family transcriptional regulator C-terminal domain-containing protein [Lachnospiraceae bacterium]|nr:TetR/AcrR family transcriptional regulator C-terminal domain-containing protein [Lachnospiraceae bacterium]